MAAPGRTSWPPAASWSGEDARARRCWPRWPTTAPTTTRRATGPRSRTCAGAAPPSCRSRWARRCRWPTSRTPCWRRSASAPTPRCPPCSSACAQAARAWPWSPTGTSRCTTCSSAPRLRGAGRRRRHLGRARRRQARSGHLPRRARAAGGQRRRGDPRRRQRRARRRRRARGRPRGGARRPQRRAGARRRARRGLPRRAADDVGHTGRLVLCIRARMSTAPSSIPPPSFDVAPELPEGVERPPPPGGPRWKPWMAWVGARRRLRRRAHGGAHHRRHRRRGGLELRRPQPRR